MEWLICVTCSSCSFSSNINMYILLTVLHIFLIATNWKILSSNQGISSLVIISFILLTEMFNQAATLLGEIACWSPLGLKRLLKMFTCLFSDHLKNYLALEICWQEAKPGKNCLIKILISRFVFKLFCMIYIIM